MFPKQENFYFLKRLQAVLALVAIATVGLFPQRVFASGPENANQVLLPGSNSTEHVVQDPTVNAIQTALLETDRHSMGTVSKKSILKGWDHLFELLVDQGEDPTTVAWLLSDDRMPTREPLYFSLHPRESHAMYRKLNSVRNRRHAKEYYLEHEEVFRRAEKEFLVPRSVILALLQVETSCGRNTGREPVFFRLARLASAAAPENIQDNFLQKQRALKLLPVSRVEERAVELQNIFLHHTAETIEVSKRLGVHPLELRGSSAGAIGIPQFLPGNVIDFGADGDDDGEVNIFNPPDAIMSVARFLNHEGWKYSEPYTSAANRAAIHSYNRSEPYVNTVLAMGSDLRRELP